MTQFRPFYPKMTYFDQIDPFNDIFDQIYVHKIKADLSAIDWNIAFQNHHHHHCSTLVEIMEFTMLRQTSRSIITFPRSCSMMPVSLEITAGYERERPLLWEGFERKRVEMNSYLALQQWLFSHWQLWRQKGGSYRSVALFNGSSMRSFGLSWEGACKFHPNVSQVFLIVSMFPIRTIR